MSAHAAEGGLRLSDKRLRRAHAKVRRNRIRSIRRQVPAKRPTVAQSDRRLLPDVDLRALSERVSRGEYPWSPARYEYDGPRLIGHPTYEDQIIQTALAELISESAEQVLPDSVHGYRPQRGPLTFVTAFRAVAPLAVGGHVVRIDIQKFFDEVPHEVVLDSLRSVCGDEIVPPIAALLAMHSAAVNPTEAKGMMQGSPLSPVLANLALLQLMQDLDARAAAGRDALLLDTTAWDEARR